MQRYVEPLTFALVMFPLAAALFTLPYVLYSYRRYGSILPMRVLCVYAFIFYLMCVYCLAILPFPSADTVVTQHVGLNLIPFSYVPEILTATVEFSIKDPSTWMSAFFASGLYEPVLNILMFLPLGVFLRYYFGWGRRKTVLTALLISLFLEVTQYTATYGLAPFRYRLTDVNDLIHNTLGGLLGYAVTPFLTGFLPTRERLNQLSYQRGRRVSYIRRLMAFLTDQALVSGAASLLGTFLPRNLCYVAMALLLGVLAWCCGGATPGKLLVRIRLADAQGGNARLWQHLARCLLLHVGVARLDIFFGSAGVLLSFLLLTAAFLGAVKGGIRNRPQTMFDRWTRTLVESSIPCPEEAAP